MPLSKPKPKPNQIKLKKTNQIKSNQTKPSQAKIKVNQTKLN